MRSHLLAMFFTRPRFSTTSLPLLHYPAPSNNHLTRALECANTCLCKLCELCDVEEPRPVAVVRVECPPAQLQVEPVPPPTAVRVPVAGFLRRLGGTRVFVVLLSRCLVPAQEELSQNPPIQQQLITIPF
jgi:hypothetical protein